MERKRSTSEYVRVKIRRFWQIARRKPRFLLGYLMRSLIFRAIVMTIYFLFFTLLPLTSVTEIVNGRVVGFLRDLPVRMQGFSFDAMITFMRTVPTDINRILANFSTLLSTRGKWLWAGIKSLWPPKQAKAKVSEFVSQHLRQVRWITRAILAFILSLIMLKLILLFVVPLLGLSAITILGVNIGVFALVILQWIVTALSKFLSRILQGQVLRWYKIINAKFAVTPLDRLAAGYRDRFVRYVQQLVTGYIRWLTQAVQLKQGEYRELERELKGVNVK